MECGSHATRRKPLCCSNLLPLWQRERFADSKAAGTARRRTPKTPAFQVSSSTRSQTSSKNAQFNFIVKVLPRIQSFATSHGPSQPCTIPLFFACSSDQTTPFLRILRFVAAIQSKCFSMNCLHIKSCRFHFFSIKVNQGKSRYFSCATSS